MSMTAKIRELTQKKRVRMGLFPVLLFLFAMLGLTRGVDLTDTTYSLGNYRFLNELEGDWIWATGLSNLAGHLLLGLSAGSMPVMSFVCRLFIVAAVFAVYFTLADEEHALPVFLGSWIALGLCWCPAVILYNYLSYLLLTLAALFLRRANRTERGRDDAVAGLLLGLSLFVRISDLVYAALIFFVFGSCIFRDGKITKRMGKRTLTCVLSYFAGAAAGLLLLIALRSGAQSGGIASMIGWVTGLASSGGQAGGYSLGAMLLTLCKAYLWALERFLPLAAVILGGGVLRLILREETQKPLRIVLVTGATALLFLLYFKRGVCTLLYYSNGSIYGIGAVLLVLLYIVFGIVLIGGKAFMTEEREEALLGLLLLLIAPLGTNNHLYAVLNQLVLILPLAFRLLKRVSEKIGGAVREPAALTLSLFFLLLLVQTSLFRANYSFADGEDGSRQDYVMANPTQLLGMRTSRAHGATVESLVRQQALAHAESLLCYGNLPGLNYVTGLRPAIPTLWPDLESYAAEDFRSALQQAAAEESAPVVILSAEAKRRIFEGSEAENTPALSEKDGCMKAFLTGNGYEIKYEDAEFILYAR